MRYTSSEINHCLTCAFVDLFTGKRGSDRVRLSNVLFSTYLHLKSANVAKLHWLSQPSGKKAIA